MRRRASWIAALSAAVALAACGVETGGGAREGVVAGRAIPTPYTKTFTVVEREGYRVVDIEASVVAWGGSAGGPRARLVLVPRGAKPPPLTGDLAGATLIRTPVQRIAVNDQSLEAVLRALGVDDRLVAVGGHDSYDDDIRARVKAGDIRQIGYGWHQPPTLDALVASKPDVLIARMADLTHTQHLERVEALGVPLVPSFIYAEPDYLGQVEWVRLVGMLVGREGEADAFVREVTGEVERLKRLAVRQPKRSFLWAWYWSASDRWSVTQRNNEAALIRDATHADCWMIRDPLSQPFTDRRALARFKAVREGCMFWQHGLPHPTIDSWEAWEMGAIRPDWLLADIIEMGHPPLRDGRWRYFEPENLEAPRAGSRGH